MDCLQSFNIRTQQSSVATNSNGTVRTWGTLGQYFFSLNHFPNNQGSIYNLGGFKRTDLYGISVFGYVQGNYANATKCADVEDWSFTLTIDGTAPLVSGSVGTAFNGFAIKSTSPGLNSVALSKNTNSIMFANPYASVKSISFEALQAQGKGAEFLNEVALIYDLTFTFYYKYEGE
jgi:hypothetical protein